MSFELADAVGISLVVLGVALRALAVKELWPHYSMHVRTPGRFVTSGIYRWVRHPMYLGSSLMLIGAAFVFMSWEGRAIIALICYLYFPDRADREERLLEEAYGDSFRQYRRATAMMIPWRPPRT